MISLPTDVFTFYDEREIFIDHLSSERTEQEQAFTYVPEDAKGILELGSRYGTVTSAISHKINKRSALISVEPDSTVWEAFEKNIKRAGANSFLVKGILSKSHIGFIQFQYGSFTTKNIDAAKKFCDYYSLPFVFDYSIPLFTLQQIQKEANIPIVDTLVADCEGFLEHFLDENPELYTTLDTIMFEKDGEDRCNYEKIEEKLQVYGFQQIISGFHSVWKKCGDIIKN